MEKIRNYEKMWSVLEMQYQLFGLRIIEIGNRKEELLMTYYKDYLKTGRHMLPNKGFIKCLHMNKNTIMRM